MGVSAGIALACGLCVAALLAAEARSAYGLRWVFKTGASLFFVAFAVSLGALQTPYGQVVLAALSFCALGDVLLIRDDRRWFLAGMGAFAIGHVAFAWAFLTAGAIAGLIVALAAIAMGVFAWRILVWLWPRLGAMRAPVAVYAVIISGMVIAAAGAVGRNWLILVGAVLFAVSDVAVARDQFVAKGLVNRLWGLPLYYGAQLILASTV